MLRMLRQAGFAVCVATSKPRPVALRVLRHFGLEQAFDYIGGASMDASPVSYTHLDVYKRQSRL